MKKTMAFYATVLHRQFLAYASEEVQKLGLNCGQLPFLLYVGKHPACTPGQLTTALHMDWGYSQRSLTRLVETGFLIRERRDARTSQLTLTELGQQAYDVSHQVFHRWDEQRLSALEPEERVQLLALLKKVSRAEVPED